MRQVNSNGLWRFAALLLLAAVLVAGPVQSLSADNHRIEDELRKILDPDVPNGDDGKPSDANEGPSFLELTIIEFDGQSAFRIEVDLEESSDDDLTKAYLSWPGGSKTIRLVDASTAGHWISLPGSNKPTPGTIAGKYTSRVIHLRPERSKPSPLGTTVFVPQETTSVTVEIGGTTTSVTVDLSRFAPAPGTVADLRIADVPEAEEFAVGGIVRVGELKRVNLTVPRGDRSTLAILSGADEIRIWKDENRTVPIAITRTIAGISRIEWEADEAPSNIWIEGVVASNAAKHVHLRFSSAGKVFTSGFDDASLTVVSLDLGFPDSVGRLGSLNAKTNKPIWLVPLNDNDSDFNSIQDRFEADAPNLGERDLVPLQVTVRPSLRVSFADVELLLSDKNISIWRSPQKGVIDTLIDQQDGSQGPSRAVLEPHQQNKRYFLEGIGTVGEPTRLELRVTPKFGAGATATPLIVDENVLVVQADIDIAGIADEQMVEVDPGGSVKVALDDDGNDTESQLTLKLRLRPSSIKSGSAELTVRNGADNVRLFKDDGFGDLEAVTVTQDENGLGHIAFENIGAIPDELIVKGAKATAGSPVKIRLTYKGPGGSAASKEVHSDEVAITVEGNKLVLEPGLVTVFNAPALQETEEQLKVFLESGNDEDRVEVQADRSTTYRWIGKGLPTSLLDLPLADIDVDNSGKLTVKSAGFQIIQARRGDLESNYSLVIAGVQLKKIVLEPESALTSTLQLTGKNPPLVLTADVNGIVSDKGWILLDDVTLSLVDGSAEVSFQEFLTTLDRLSDLLALSPQTALGKIAVVLATSGAKGIFKYIGTQFVDFSSADKAIITLSPGKAGTKGFVQAGLPGITSVTGKLEIDGLGDASDSVLSIVLPNLETAEIRADGDPVGQHSDSVEVDASEPDKAVRRLRAHVSLLALSGSPIPYGDSVGDFLPEGWSTGEFDVPLLNIESIGMNCRMNLKNVQQGGDKGAVTIRDLRCEFDIPNERAALVGLTNKWKVFEPQLIQIVERENISIKISPVANPELGSTNIGATVALAGMGSVFAVRPVNVVGSCVAGKPVVRLQNQVPLEELDALFLNGSPFKVATANADGEARGSGNNLGPIVGDPAALRAGSPTTAGWLYTIEFPVNETSLCELVVQRSVAVGEGADIRNLPLVNRIGTDVPTATGERKEALGSASKYSIVYAGAPGWRQHGGARAVKRIVQRVSVRDKTSGKFLATALYNLQMTLDPSSGYFSATTVGSSGGLVGKGFNHDTPINAKTRFSGIAPP